MIARLAVCQLVVDGNPVNILPVYVVVAGLCLITILRVFQRQSVDQPPRYGKQLTWSEAFKAPPDHLANQ